MENWNKIIGGDFWCVDICGLLNIVVIVYDKNNGLYEVVFLIEEFGFYRVEIVLDYLLCKGFKDLFLDWFIWGNNRRNLFFMRNFVVLWI